MPTYEYACQTCGQEFEVFQSIKADPLTTCTCERKEPVQRKIGRGAGIIFKGSGFYETDYRRAPEAGRKEAGAAPAAEPAKGGDAAKAPAPASAPSAPCSPSCGCAAPSGS